ncbi:hypothetical protein B296_00059237 [Ensete ventricosum]|uniref:Uncharacterized protein n=1 Tax=Ensete ventricosum TaxID=4639 RepID=A0A426XDJ5_ENSVE|nr:hypothetical protein B296_00059237 [Ensete ventricosum]
MLLPLSSSSTVATHLGYHPPLGDFTIAAPIIYIIIVEHLEEVRKCYNIPREYVLHIPLPGQHPYDAFSDGFELSIDALEHRTLVPTSPHDRGLPQGMADLTIANGAQLMALHGGIPRGMYDLLLAKIRELKLGVGPEALATAGRWATNFEAEVERLKAALGEAK